jgi:hypothetical protein
MTLHDKIIKIYPSLTWQDFSCFNGTIQIQNDGEGDYIKSWTNSNPQPTADQLNAIS